MPRKAVDYFSISYHGSMSYLTLLIPSFLFPITESMGRFTLDADTGKVRTQGREPFELNYEYVLGVSAPNIGAANKRESPSQVLYITGGELNPQPYEDPFIFNMPETTTVNAK